MRARPHGFTLIELLTALLILALLALMSYRGLAAVLDTRSHLSQESSKWRQVNAFFARFERDIQLAAPRPTRIETGSVAAWLGRPDSKLGAHLEFSRFATNEGIDAPRRLAYHLNDKQEIELWLWNGLDGAPGQLPEHHVVLTGVTRFELHYLAADLTWVDTWSATQSNLRTPRALRVRIILASGEEIVRVFGLGS